MAAPLDTLRTELVRSLRAFEALAPGWDELVLAMPRPSPFLLHDVCAAWWSRPDTADLVVAVAWRGTRLVAALPLDIRRVAGVRIASFPGRNNSSLADLLIAPDEPPETARALLAILRDAPYDIAMLSGVPGGSRLAGATAGLTWAYAADAPVLVLEDGFDAVLRDRVQRDHRKSRAKRLRQLHEAGSVEFTVATTADELARELPFAFEIFERRRADLPDNSGFATPWGRRYYLELARRVGPRGYLRLLVLRLDGRPISFQLYWRLGTTAVLTMVAFEPELARFSPGKLAFYEASSRASADGATRIELLARLDGYKRELRPELEPLYRGIGLARGLRGRAAGAALALAVAGRSRLRGSARGRSALERLRRLRGE